MPANAGAWIASEGGQEITTSLVGERDGLTFYEGALYWEEPIDERTSAVLAPWMEQNYDTLEGWRAEATLAVKRTLYREDETVVAVQVGALWVSHPATECSEGGAEIRALAGRSFEQGRFLNLEAAARGLDGGCGGERLDLTAGFRPRENWLAMGQVFYDSPRDGDEITRAQVSLVRFGESGRGIQLGLRGRIDGGPQEVALVLGLWGRPGD